MGRGTSIGLRLGPEVLVVGAGPKGSSMGVAAALEACGAGDGEDEEGAGTSPAGAGGAAGTEGADAGVVGETLAATGGGATASVPAAGWAGLEVGVASRAEGAMGELAGAPAATGALAFSGWWAT